VPVTLAGPVSDPQHPLRPVYGGTPSQPGSDDALVVDLRRVATIADGLPPHVQAELRSLHAQPHGGGCICHECTAADLAEDGAE
jgi:hypothetical protein